MTQSPPVASTSAGLFAGSLTDLRHDLAWGGIDHPGPFHACQDPAPVRARVYAAIAPFQFTVDTIVLEKSKAQPHIRQSDERFYQYAWYYLMKHVAPLLTRRGDDLLVVASSVANKKKKRQAFHDGVADVMRQVAGVRARTACWDGSSEWPGAALETG